MKRMLCTINSSIWICCKTCYKTTQALHFYCTWCGPASGFHKAVSVYHTWLSNNPVVGQTQLYPEDRTPENPRWSSLYTSLFSQSPLSPISTLFVLAPVLLIHSTPYFGVSYMVSLTYLPASSLPVSILGYPLLPCSLKPSLTGALTLHPFPLILHPVPTRESRSTRLNARVELGRRALQGPGWKYFLINSEL